jgi:hypothetical protein
MEHEDPAGEEKMRNPSIQNFDKNVLDQKGYTIQ